MLETRLLPPVSSKMRLSRNGVSRLAATCPAASASVIARSIWSAIICRVDRVGFGDRVADQHAAQPERELRVEQRRDCVGGIEPVIDLETADERVQKAGKSSVP